MYDIAVRVSGERGGRVGASGRGGERKSDLAVTGST